ncbi:MAG: hypothetical protein B1H02_07720 [Candidatus Latescibacteria bacterium 4484_107]|nr:MAG: hypothetical protein B1H02_07720 [Candidatus Latescibacteria bacterium 4484_107]
MRAEELDQAYQALLKRIHDRFRNLNLAGIKIKFRNELRQPIITVLNKHYRYLTFENDKDKPVFSLYNKKFDDLDGVISYLKDLDRRSLHPKLLTKEDIKRYKADYEEGQAIVQKIGKLFTPTLRWGKPNESDRYYQLPHTPFVLILEPPPDFESLIGKSRKESKRVLQRLIIWDRPAKIKTRILPGSIRTRLKALLKRVH